MLETPQARHTAALLTRLAVTLYTVKGVQKIRAVVVPVGKYPVT